MPTNLYRDGTLYASGICRDWCIYADDINIKIRKHAYLTPKGEAILAMYFRQHPWPLSNTIRFYQVLLEKRKVGFLIQDQHQPDIHLTGVLIQLHREPPDVVARIAFSSMRVDTTIVSIAPIRPMRELYITTLEGESDEP